MPIIITRPDPYAATLTARPVPVVPPPPPPAGAGSLIVTDGYGAATGDSNRIMSQGY